jgi:aryl-alcohol dehydrogenase-like predicted oxidoreductase
MVLREVERAANALRRYDAIHSDVGIRPSAVLLDRLRETERELLALTGTESVAQAREQLAVVKPSLAVSPEQKALREQKRERAAKYDPRSDSGNSSRARASQPLPPRITTVVSGGLPGTER